MQAHRDTLEGQSQMLNLEKAKYNNEVHWISKDGKSVPYPMNDNLLMLYSPLKNKYDVNNSR